MMIYDWRFWVGGKQVAFCSGTVHGDSGGHCELHDVDSGKTLETIDGQMNDDSPKRARGLHHQRTPAGHTSSSASGATPR